MTCSEIQAVLHCFVDGELDPVKSQEIALHLEGCPECLAVVQRFQSLARNVADAGNAYGLPPGLEQRIRKAIRRESERGIPRLRSPRRVLALAFVFAMVITATWGLATWWSGTQHEDILAQEILQSHIRSLMPDHLIDVVSSDQHTVKPWFDGKVDFSPIVKDLSSDGFTLIGGRLDYVNNRPVSAIVYKRRLHIINLFTWPQQSGGDQQVRLTSRQGYQLSIWSTGGMMYYAVSDINANELADFTRLTRQ